MQELAKGVGINFLGNFLRFSRAFFFVAAAYLFGVENFGVYTIVWATADILLKFGTLGLEKGLLFEVSHLLASSQEDVLYHRIAASLKATFLVSIFEALALLGYIHVFVDNPQIRTNLYLLAPVLPLNAVTLVFIHATMGLKDMRQRVLIRDGLEPLTMLIFLVIFSRWEPIRFYGIVAAQCLALFFSFLAAGFIFRRSYSFSKLLHVSRAGGGYFSLIRYSLPIYSTEMFDILLFRLDVFLIGFFLGTGTAAQKTLIGVYGLARQIARVLTHGT